MKLPEIHHQIQTTSSQDRKDSNTGDYSPHDDVHLIEISSKMDGGIVGVENSGEDQLQVDGTQELTKHDKYFEEAEHDQQQRKEPTNQVQQSKGKDVQTVNRVA
ncbi:hypothetical protein EJD97_001244 [Solanum chilense]|uniref:Uncharacterized protein n=1 Tax=Solanum chilense TaxID=4083 RepID=A0A6N2AR01_SOLCI|nr:hypothetical protein EJD97_001244 [Solanum chilense]